MDSHSSSNISQSIKDISPMVAISHKTTPKDHLRNKVQYDEKQIIGETT